MCSIQWSSSSHCYRTNGWSFHNSLISIFWLLLQYLCRVWLVKLYLDHFPMQWMHQVWHQTHVIALHTLQLVRLVHLCTSTTAFSQWLCVNVPDVKMAQKQNRTLSLPKWKYSNQILLVMLHAMMWRTVFVLLLFWMNTANCLRNLKLNKKELNSALEASKQ